jgi:hypothetical protein
MMFILHRRHTYGTLLSVTGIALLVYMQMLFVLHRRHTYGPLLPVTGIALLVIYKWCPYFAGDTHMGHYCYYGDSFTCLYLNDVHTSQETHIWTITGIALHVHMQMMFVPHRRHTYGTLLPVTGIALLVYMQLMFVLHRRHTYGPLLGVTGLALHLI